MQNFESTNFGLDHVTVVSSFCLDQRTVFFSFSIDHVMVISNLILDYFRYNTVKFVLIKLYELSPNHAQQNMIQERLEGVISQSHQRLAEITMKEYPWILGFHTQFHTLVSCFLFGRCMVVRSQSFARAAPSTQRRNSLRWKFRNKLSTTNLRVSLQVSHV